VQVVPPQGAAIFVTSPGASLSTSEPTGGGGPATAGAGMSGPTSPASTKPELSPSGTTPTPVTPGAGSGAQGAAGDTSAASTATTGRSTAAGAYPGHGAITPPATSASYAAGGGGVVTVLATWGGTEELQVEISCPGGVSSARTGSSPLSLELDDGHGGGNCIVALRLPAGATAGVSFTLVVSPAP